MSHQHSHSHGGGGSCCGGKQQEQQPAPTNFLQACTSGAMGVVCAFFDGHDSVNLADDNGCTALHWAALNGHAHVVRFLLDNGAPINVPESQGQTALHFAASQNHGEVIGILLDGGFDPFAVDSNNNTAHGTAACNDALVALHVLQTRARLEPTHADGQGNTILAWGAYKGNLDIVRHSHEMFGVPVETYGKLNRTPLHWAAREGHTDVCVYLMGKGLDPFKPDAEGKTALQYATERHHPDCATALKEHRKAPKERNVSTLTAFFQTHSSGYRTHLFALAGFLTYSVICFILLQWVPPFLLFTFLVGWITKNNVHTFLRWSPVLSHRDMSDSEALMGDMPKTFTDAMEGPKHLWGREPTGVVGLPVLIFFQLFTLGGGGGHLEFPSFLSLSAHHHHDGGEGKEHDHHDHGFETNIPMAIIWSLFFAKVFALIVKSLGSRDIIPNNTNIADYPLWEAIDNKKWDDVKAANIVFDKEALIRKPARAFWCRQIGHVIKRYDSWSVSLDCPLNHHNVRWFFFFILSLFLAQFFMLRSTWDNAMIRNGCLVPDRSASAAAHAAPVYHWAHELHAQTMTAPPLPTSAHHHHDSDDHEHQQHLLSRFNNNVYNWCTVAVSLLLQANPCPNPHSLLGGHDFTKMTWREILVGDERVRADIITILLPMVLSGLLLIDLFGILRRASACISTIESNGSFNIAPSSEGGVTSIKKPHGFGSIYGEGNLLANLFLFFVGKDGERWDGVMTVPGGVKKNPVPHPLVCPPPKKKGHNHEH